MAIKMKLNDYEEADDLGSIDDDYGVFAGKRKMAVLIILAVLMCVLLLVLIAAVWYKNFPKNTDEKASVVISDETQQQQPADISEEMNIDIDVTDVDTSEEVQAKVIAGEKGSAVDEESLSLAIAENETAETTIGIDVAKYQGTIDFKQVADAGIEFVMVRIGYRTAKTGIITEDVNAAYNLQQAQANGIKLGAYFFSTAITEEEAREEADYVADFIAKYPITYPVAFNYEGFTDSENRNYGLSNDERTTIALAFLNEISDRGYTPMFYSSKNEMENNAYWNMDSIEKSVKVWVSQYPQTPYPQTKSSSYSGTHAMWQYTNQGTIPGISKKVDINVAYFGYSSENAALDGEAPEAVEANVEALMNFKDVNETVTAKNTTNLRTEPSTTGDTVAYVLKNGDVASRTGIDEASGWSRVEYNGQTLYAVSSYLTTDLDAQPQNTTEKNEASDAVTVDGVTIKTTFTEINDHVTAKDVVNLRSLPSVTNESVKVVGTLSAGEVLTRTGINYEYGWSRLDYNGQTVYAITSYLTETE
jgi:GH25 family lysozyme M1 (1,4-beta-N-acetylmuramidase)